MARNKKEACVLVIDVGPHMNELINDQETAIESAKQCCVSIVERKIFAESKDEVAVVIFGCPEQCDLAADLGYSAIDIKSDLMSVNWKIVQSLEELSTGFEQGDFVQAVTVSLELLKQQCQGKKASSYTQKRIFVFSNMAGGTDSKSKVKSLSQNLIQEEIDLRFIGFDKIEGPPDEHQPSTSDGQPPNGPSGKPKTPERLEAERIASTITEAVDGEVYTFEEASVALRGFHTRQVNPAAVQLDLEIGPNLSIPVTSFKKNNPVDKPKWSLTTVKEAIKNQGNEGNDELPQLKRFDDSLQTMSGAQSSGEVRKAKELISEGGEIVDEENIMKYYKYGRDKVPMSEQTLSYLKGLKQNFQRSLKILHFCPKSEIKTHTLRGESHVVVAGIKAGRHAATRFSALVRALHELGYVAIVRKIHAATYCPKIGCLFPEVGNEKNNDALYFVELPYKGEESDFKFASLPTEGVNAEDKKMQEKLDAHRPSQKQLEVVDDLIDSMMLATSDDPNEEMFSPYSTRDPSVEHLFRAVGQRIRNPDINIALPQASDNFHMPNLTDNQRRIFEEMEIFNLTDRTLESLQDPGDVAGDTLMSNQRTNLFETYSNLLRDQTLSLRDVVNQMANEALSALKTESVNDIHTPFIKFLASLRTDCINQKKPNLFNDFLKNLFNALPCFEMFSAVVDAKLDMITVEECYDGPGSVSVEEATKFVERIKSKSVGKLANSTKISPSGRSSAENYSHDAEKDDNLYADTKDARDFLSDL